MKTTTVFINVTKTVWKTFSESTTMSPYRGVSAMGSGTYDMKIDKFDISINKVLRLKNCASK